MSRGIKEKKKETNGKRDPSFAFYLTECSETRLNIQKRKGKKPLNKTYNHIWSHNQSIFLIFYSLDLCTLNQGHLLRFTLSYRPL